MQEIRTREHLWAELEALGEEEVRINFARGVYGNVGDKKALVAIWLQQKETLRHDAREEQTLALAKEANEIARASSREVRKDRKLAVAALIVAAIAAHEEIAWLFAAVLQWSGVRG